MGREKLNSAPTPLPQSSNPQVHVYEEWVGKGEANLKRLSGSVVSGQKPLPSWREKPMAHLRLGAEARGVQTEVRLQVCLALLASLFPLSDQVKRQSPTCCSLVRTYSALALGVGVGTNKE